MDHYRIDGHKLYWHLDRVLAWQKGEVIPPLYVEISPVSYCNHRCIFCGVDFAMVERHKLPADIFNRQLREMGRLGVRSVMFAGEGEPLLHDNLGAMVNEARQAGLDVSITTNGSLGNETLWREILPALTWLRFSVDAASDPVYSAVHGVGDNQFKRTLASIAAACEVKAQFDLPVTLGVQFLVLEENLDDLPKAIELYSKMGLDYLSFKPYSRHPQSIKTKDIDYDNRLFDRIEAEIERSRTSNGAKIIFRRNAMKRYGAREIAYRHCRALPFWGYVDSKGDFYTCSVFLGKEEFKAGNVLEQDLASVFFGAKRCASIDYGLNTLDPVDCRVNCRMAPVNEFLETLANPPEHVNFI